MSFKLPVKLLSDSFFFFNDTATTEIYTLSLHDALPISDDAGVVGAVRARALLVPEFAKVGVPAVQQVDGVHVGEGRSEEHTSELQSHLNLVCRLLLEKKKKNKHRATCSRPTQ